MGPILRLAGFPAVLLALSLPANAAMYKCTDADGNVRFSDKFCPTQPDPSSGSNAFPTFRS